MNSIKSFIGDKKWMGEPDRPNGGDWIWAIELLEQVDKENKKLQAEIERLWEAALEQHRWIPVSEKLPKESGSYLVMIKYTHTICALPMVDMYSTQDSMWGSSHKHTHWKPIILPVKEKENGRL